MPDPGPLAADLAGIRARAAQITDDHDVAVCIADLGGPCSGHDAERLADVVEAVLRDHEPRTRIPPNRHYAICRACSRIWPCATVEAITSKLLGKEDSDGT